MMQLFFNSIWASLCFFGGMRAEWRKPITITIFQASIFFRLFCIAIISGRSSAMPL